MIRNKISSDIQDLNALHSQYYWIPDETMIRPSQNILENKKSFSKYILHNWMSFQDFILDTHFKYPISIEDGHLYILNKVINSEWKFSKSLFPYNLPENVNHYVLWNSFYNYFADLDDLTINTIIKDNLQKMVGSNFDFAWYKNPNPSISELWHCQVFWIRI